MEQARLLEFRKVSHGLVVRDDWEVVQLAVAEPFRELVDRGRTVDPGEHDRNAKVDVSRGPSSYRRVAAITVVLIGGRLDLSSVRRPRSAGASRIGKRRE